MKIERILKYLQCPYCQSKRLLLKTKNKITCPKCQNRFSVVKGVPVLMKSDQLGKQEKHQREWFE